MCSKGYCSWVCVCACVRVWVVRFSNVYLLYPTGDADQMICGNFAIHPSFKSCGVICLPRAFYSGILRNFSTAEPSKALKRLTVV